MAWYFEMPEIKGLGAGKYYRFNILSMVLFVVIPMVLDMVMGVMVALKRS